MTTFAVNPDRTDPYKNFKFRVKWDGKYVPELTSVSGLVRHIEVIETRDGGSNSLVRATPGRVVFEPITLERGVTHDNAFEEWANLAWTLNGSPEMSLKRFRKEVQIDLFNEAGQLVIRYVVHQAWPSTYQALPGLDSLQGAIAVERLVLQHGGWERDTSVTEPAEP